MNKPIRTTIVYALIGWLVYLSLGLVLGRQWHHWSNFHYVGFQFVVWAQLAVYAVLLARWSQTPAVSIIFPMLLLLIMAVLPNHDADFILFSLGMLCWIRSGICYQGAPLRNAIAEFVTIVGGAALVLFLVGTSTLSSSLGFLLFGLVQALYFFIIPSNKIESTQSPPPDPFERAFQEAQKIVDAG